ncbi:helix-turn-helix domain-containing protein, partial [Gordonibacter sp.]
AGVIRGVALLHQEISQVVNGASMLGALAAAVVLLVLWQRMSFRFGLTSVFRVVYPLVITGFLLLPYLGPGYLNLFAAFTYLVFSLVQMLMMMQCAQISRDRGINPVFVYGFFGGVAYIMQSAGFLLGWLSDFISLGNSEWLFVVAMASSYVLGMTLLATTGTLFRPLTSKGAATADPIEFLPLAGKPVGEVRVKRGGALAALGATTGGSSGPEAQASGEKAPKKRRNRPSASDDAGVIRDRVSKQCLDLQEAYGLSLRETEVMELIARGNSMASIAERLVISENTVRTHAKHIYTKLAIHKRQELLDMLGQLEG